MWQMTCCTCWAPDVLHMICTRLHPGHLSVRVGDCKISEIVPFNAIIIIIIALSDFWHYRVSAWTGRPCVSILWLGGGGRGWGGGGGGGESWICSVSTWQCIVGESVCETHFKCCSYVKQPSSSLSVSYILTKLPPCRYFVFRKALWLPLTFSQPPLFQCE